MGHAVMVSDVIAAPGSKVMPTLALAVRLGWLTSAAAFSLAAAPVSKPAAHVARISQPLQTSAHHNCKLRWDKIAEPVAAVHCPTMLSTGAHTHWTFPFWRSQKQAVHSTKQCGQPPAVSSTTQHLWKPMQLLKLWKGRHVVSRHEIYRFVGGLAVAGVAFLVSRRSVSAMTGPVGPVGEVELVSTEVLLTRLALWGVLFLASAAFHSAEIAITTLYPWKVKEFAEEEGEKSCFQALNKDITRVLTTILVVTTLCSIYSAALFTNLAIQMFGSKGLTYATAVLTLVTLFFGELLPKALGVNNAEMVARKLVPLINVLAYFVSPVGKAFSFLSKLLLTVLGFKSADEGRVTEEELRLIVTGAAASGTIENKEGKMIKGVLDLQDTKVSEIMRPRVEVVAIEINSSMRDLYTVVTESKYSRIPVFDGEIDKIAGVVLSKDLLDFVHVGGPGPATNLETVTVKDMMESTYFVPDSMSVWNVLEEMRKRRLHMAIVVDEYGGTAGIVTLEDILEEVVGEIYDEEDEDYDEREEHYINVNQDGSFTIHGMADLEDVCTSLNFNEVKEEDLGTFGTISGFLCSQAGEIPAVGDYILYGNFMFTITKADERRIVEVHARPLEPFIGEEGFQEEPEPDVIDVPTT